MAGVFKMETPIDYNAVLADLRKKREEIDRAIAGIEIVLGLAPSSASASVATTHGHSASGDLGEDAFFGMSIAEAAKKYLQFKKKPQTTQVIAAALKAHGLQNASESFSNTVGSVINRNADPSNNPTFVRVGRATWGLKSWYPNHKPKPAKPAQDGKQSSEANAQAQDEEMLSGDEQIEEGNAKDLV